MYGSGKVRYVGSSVVERNWSVVYGYNEIRKVSGRLDWERCE